MLRIAAAATLALDLLLLAAFVAWQWVEHRPAGQLGGSPMQWQLPILLTVFALAAGAVALIASRRANVVLLFLVDFASVLLAAWLFQHLYHRFTLARMLSGR